MTDVVDAAVALLVRQQVPSLFLVVDQAGRVVESNRHTKELLGGTLQDAQLTDLVVEFDRGLSPHALAAGGEAVSRRVNFITFTGLPQTYTCWFARAADHVVIVGGPEPREAEILRRDLLVMTQEIAATNRALQKANRALEAMGREKTLFLGMASHDLRSPISAIGAYAVLIREQLAGPPPPRLADYLDAIVEAASSMRDIVTSFLDVAVIDLGHIRVDRKLVEPRDLVRAALRLVHPMAEARAVRVRSGVDARPIYVDPERVKQALVNLLNNAIEHSPEGETVDVVVRTCGEHVEIEVHNAGPGIPAEVRANLFAAFTHGGARTSAFERSTGLGLAITRKIAEAHGGVIEWTSDAAAGTTFTIRLPDHGRGQDAENPQHGSPR